VVKRVLEPCFEREQKERKRASHLKIFGALQHRAADSESRGGSGSSESRGGVVLRDEASNASSSTTAVQVL
jgi:hypothetical protein